MAATQVRALQLRIETSAGTAVWRTLEWDTEQFGIPAGRLELLDASGSYAEARARKRE